MESLSTELISLLFAVVLALFALVERVRRDLDNNTSLTKETKSAANGTLKGVMEALDAERRENSKLQLQLRDQENRIAFITSRLPEAKDIMSSYQERREECPYRRML